MSHVTRISTSHFDDTGLSEWVRHMREGSTGGNSQLAAQLNQISIGFVTYQSALLHICIVHEVGLCEPYYSDQKQISCQEMYRVCEGKNNGHFNQEFIIIEILTGPRGRLSEHY